MIEKKDIASLTGWSVTGAFLYSVVPVAITVWLNAVIGNATAQELLMLEGLVLTSATAMGTSRNGVCHALTLRNKYGSEKLKVTTDMIVGTVAGICGGIYGVIDKMLADNENSNISEFTPVWLFAYGVGVGIVGSNLFEGEESLEGLSIESLRQRGKYGFETYERKNDVALKKALVKIQKSNENVYKLLEKYNKVYTRKFAELGTPMEMATRANNKELAKKLHNENRDLILTALYDVKNSRARELETIKII